uniref:Xenotropic and polytropic retrovirus receptor 1 homolog n=1 Tax=Esox lucius TaxID=8010 RepID=C1BZC9_ESOLU|nr:Xenotropic and polytropic retrovirus receptor 1 homolog [Esox lucius]
MKFAEHLSSHITPEWRKQYLQYEVISLGCALCIQLVFI